MIIFKFATLILYWANVLVTTSEGQKCGDSKAQSSRTRKLNKKKKNNSNSISLTLTTNRLEGWKFTIYSTFSPMPGKSSWYNKPHSEDNQKLQKRMQVTN